VAAEKVSRELVGMGFGGNNFWLDRRSAIRFINRNYLFENNAVKMYTKDRSCKSDILLYWAEVSQTWWRVVQIVRRQSGTTSARKNCPTCTFQAAAQAYKSREIRIYIGKDTIAKLSFFSVYLCMNIRACLLAFVASM
jgi:hypothetical protein